MLDGLDEVLDLEGRLLEVNTLEGARQTMNVRKYHGLGAIYTCTTGSGEEKLMVFEPGGSSHELLK
jgi:hypothetical protein